MGDKTTEMKILFVCKANRFRSKIAEAIFAKENKNKNIEIKSAGVKLDILTPYVSENVMGLLGEKGYKVVNEASQQINEKLIEWADKIVLVADNVNPDLLPKNKTIVWPIHDANEWETKKIRETILILEKKIKDLLKMLNAWKS